MGSSENKKVSKEIKEELKEARKKANMGQKDHDWYDSMNENASEMLNKLRAAVLGANDGVVSTAGLVLGMVGATSNTDVIFTAGLAGMTAGALSMAVGEYISVSSQRDTEEALLELEKTELELIPEQELEELTNILVEKGISRDTARQAAIEMTNHDALRAHLDFELGMNPDELTNPMHAAVSSAIAFIIGSSIPLLCVKLSPISIMFNVILAAAEISLIFTGYFAARLGRANTKRAMLRNLIGGILAMVITFGIGSMFGINV